MKYIIYDFNGTILDDVDVGVKCLNYLVDKYHIREKAFSRDEYLDIFTFPVIDYYRNAGFTFEDVSFEIIGQEWIEKYQSLKDEYHLVEGIKDILEANLKKGYKNIILSASKLDNLIAQCKELGIYDYFEDILGIGDIYAGSKEYIAKEWIKDKDPSECIFIGDTIHDLEVAKAMNVRCALVASGHQARYRLEAAHNEVYDNISGVKYD